MPAGRESPAPGPQTRAILSPGRAGRRCSPGAGDTRKRNPGSRSSVTRKDCGPGGRSAAAADETPAPQARGIPSVLDGPSGRLGRLDQVGRGRACFFRVAPRRRSRSFVPRDPVLKEFLSSWSTSARSDPRRWGGRAQRARSRSRPPPSCPRGPAAPSRSGSRPFPARRPGSRLAQLALRPGRSGRIRARSRGRARHADPEPDVVDRRARRPAQAPSAARSCGRPPAPPGGPDARPPRSVSLAAPRPDASAGRPARPPRRSRRPPAPVGPGTVHSLAW